MSGYISLNMKFRRWEIDGNPNKINNSAALARKSNFSGYKSGSIDRLNKANNFEHLFIHFNAVKP